MSRLAVEVACQLLGSGLGRLIDIACGTGIAFDAVTASGWSPVGLDLSKDQLSLASHLLTGRLVLADARHLPFDSGSFDAGLSLLSHTDIGDPAGLFAEAARVLQPGARFVHVGTHPCFVTPFFQRRPGPPYAAHEGYRQMGFYASGPGFGTGIRGRVGAYHVPLGSLLTEFAIRFDIDEVLEPGPEDYPILLAVSGRRRESLQ
ncbi:MAG: class I SAM-dependent methyltransferase [Actinomycetota bacterium]|nr:class I SAM-dependent methyltransferase [Actinomycetota bacterium]